MLCLLLLVIGLSLFYGFYAQTHDLLNPFSIASFVWCFTAAISSLNLSRFEEPWSPEMYAAVMLSLVSIAVVGLCSLRGVNKRSYIVSDRIACTSGQTFFYYIICTLCIACSIYEASLNGFKITIFYAVGWDLKSEYIQSTSIISWGVSLLPYCAVLAMYRLFFSAKVGIKEVAFDVVITIYAIIYSLMFQLSRGTLIIIALSMLFLLSRRFRLKIYHIGTFVLVVLLGFASISLVRINISSAVFSYTDADPIINAVYSYISSSFNNLNTIINHTKEYTVFAQTMPILDLGNTVEEHLFTAGFLNAQTYLSQYYRDLGIFGIMVYPAIVFALVGLIYRKSINNNMYIPLMAFIQKPIWMIFFGNYFLVSGYNLLPILFGIAWIIIPEIEGRSRHSKIRDVRIMRPYERSE